MIEVRATHELQPFELDDALKFCGSASKLEAYKVGWIPLAAYRGATLQRRLLICFNNEEKVGFCLWKHSFGDMAIYQIWVRPDARLILHGKAIVAKLHDIGQSLNCRLLKLWCAEDLAANIFWLQIAFEKKGWRHGPKRTSKRRHLLWTQRINHDPEREHGQSAIEQPESIWTPRP